MQFNVEVSSPIEGFMLVNNHQTEFNLAINVCCFQQKTQPRPPNHIQNDVSLSTGAS